jgi:hypothetical protein
MSLPIRKNLKNLPLPLRQVVRNSVRRHVFARQKPHDYFSGSLFELRLRVTRSPAEFDDLLRATPPSLDETAPIKHLSNEWIPRLGRVLAFQIRHGDFSRERSSARNLQAVVKDGDTHGTTRNRIITVAQRVDERFAQSQRREDRQVCAFKDSRLYSACHRQVASQEKVSLVEKLKGVTSQLALVDEFGLRGTAESSQPQTALGIVRQHLLAEGDNGGPQQPAIHPQAELVQRLPRRGDRSV